MKRIFRYSTALKMLPFTLKLGAILIVASFLFILSVGLYQMFLDTQHSRDESINDGIDKKYSEGVLRVSPQVEAYRELVEREANINGIGEHTNLILALMMQESGGAGRDPMQASESLCGRIGCIDDPELSIIQGVKFFKSTMKRANNDIELGLQSYNFGGGFIDYVKINGGKYSKELSISFSRMMYDKLKHTGAYRCHRPEAITHNACYGDIGYVDAVLKYLPVSIDNSGKTSGSLGELSSPMSTVLIKTSNFGWRIHPIFHTKKLHEGVDINCNTGESIHAVKDGMVVKSDSFGDVMLGEYVKIQHSTNEYTTYGHLSSRSVMENQQVKAGQIIGACGSTGSSTAPHLHFEIHSALWTGHVDPAPYLGI